MATPLSKIYFDDKPVKLGEDAARPTLARIVRAGGKSPNRVDVVVLRSPKDEAGHLLNPHELIDRTVEPAKPIYLRSVPKLLQAPAAMANNDAVIAQLGRDPADRQAESNARARRRDEAQGLAEDEAEERQEEEREQEDVLQDEPEDAEHAKEDDELKG